MTKYFRWIPLLMLPWLAGCVNDGAAYVIDGPDYALSVVREQNFFWERKVELSLVVSRLPDCQRKHVMGRFAPQRSVELWQFGDEGTYILRVGDLVYVTETRSCEGFAELTEVPEGGFGTPLGTFSVRRGVFAFVPAVVEEPDDVLQP